MATNIMDYKDTLSQDEQLDRWRELIAYWRWYPDLFLEAITPTKMDEETGEIKKFGVEWGADQKLLLRTMARFAYNFEVLPRGFGKTTLEILILYIFAILYPDSQWSMSAQTLQTSAGFFADKHEDICRFYPIIASEMESVRITDNNVIIKFKSGSVVTNITNSGNAKGLRRHGCTFEEAALMNFVNYQDNTEPITSEEYKSVLKYMSEFDPYSRNKQNFVTTAYYKNEAYEFCRQMVIDMAMCKESFVFGASYRLPAKFNRNRSVEAVEALIDKVGQTMFNFNYASRWSLTNGKCIVDVDLLREAQTLSECEMKGAKQGEYFISIDVARSAKTSNNASAIAIIRVRRDSKNKVRELQAVNMIKLPNGLNFKQQSIICKKLCKLFNPQALIVDINGLGKGLLDYLLDENIDEDGATYEPFDMINTEYRSDYRNAKRMVYGIEAQSNNTEMITTFINVVETKILRLLAPFDVNKALDIPDDAYMVSEILPFLRTENFIDEVQNLTVEQIENSRKLKIVQLVKADKDLFSALEMGLWTIMTHHNSGEEEVEDVDLVEFFSGMMRKPTLRKR